MARLEELERVLGRLREAASGQIVVVEGRRDLAALETLGVGGEHRLVNKGLSLEVWMDRLVEEAAGRLVILLLDWDRTGGRLMARLREGLRARLLVEGELRRQLATACHTRCLEEVPSELASLRHAVHPT